MIGVHLADFLEHCFGPLRVALGEHFLAHRNDRLDLRGKVLRRSLDGQLAKQLVDHALELGLGAILGEVGDGLALEESEHRRDRLDLELSGEEFFRLDVDLDEEHALIGIIRRQFVKQRAQLLARAAPFGPEIEDHEAGHRWFDDIALESLDRGPLVLAHAQRRHAISPRSSWSRIWRRQARAASGVAAAITLGPLGGCGPAGPMLAARSTRPVKYRSANRAGVAQG